MTVTLTPVERTNWALSAWNSTLDWIDVPSAWLYGQDHLWATQDLVCSPRSFSLPTSPPLPPPASHPPTPYYVWDEIDAHLRKNRGTTSKVNCILFNRLLIPVPSTSKAGNFNPKCEHGGFSQSRSHIAPRVELLSTPCV